LLRKKSIAGDPASPEVPIEGKSNSIIFPRAIQMKIDYPKVLISSKNRGCFKY
jgi:hypothetical protein